VFDIARGLRIECRYPQKPDSVLRKNYGVKQNNTLIDFDNVPSDNSDNDNDRGKLPPAVAVTKQKRKSNTSETNTIRGKHRSVGRGGSGRGDDRVDVSKYGGRGTAKRTLKKDVTSSSSEDEEVEEIVDRKRLRSDNPVNVETNTALQLEEMRNMLMESQRMVKMLSSKVEEQAIEINKSKSNQFNNESSINQTTREAPTQVSIIGTSLGNYTVSADAVTSKLLLDAKAHLLMKEFTATEASINVSSNNAFKPNKGLLNLIFQSGMNFSKSQLLEEQLDSFKLDANRRARFQEMQQSLFEAFS
jgi:hypothetical protein